jgi:hypothetical protein
MTQNIQPEHNCLDIYRRRMGFTPNRVARLLGHKNISALSHYERGPRLPSFVNALRLGIILRTPVEFLFPTLYVQLRKQIRAEEEALGRPGPLVETHVLRTQHALF